MKFQIEQDYEIQCEKNENAAEKQNAINEKQSVMNVKSGNSCYSQNKRTLIRIKVNQQSLK